MHSYELNANKHKSYFVAFVPRAILCSLKNITYLIPIAYLLLCHRQGIHELKQSMAMYIPATIESKRKHFPNISGYRRVNPEPDSDFILISP